jgi:hypothetical protein
LGAKFNIFLSQKGAIQPLKILFQAISLGWNHQQLTTSDVTSTIMLIKVQSIVTTFVKPFGHWMLKSDHDVNQYALTTTSIVLCFVTYESFRLLLLP